MLGVGQSKTPVEVGRSVSHSSLGLKWVIACVKKQFYLNVNISIVFLYFLHSPEQRFTDLVREDSEEDPLPRLILKRQNSLSDESGPPEVCMHAI